MNQFAQPLKSLYLTIASIVILNPVGISCFNVNNGAKSIALAQEIQQIAQLPKLKDTGDIKIFHNPVEDETYEEVHLILKNTKVFEEIAAGLNEELALPNDIEVYFQECGEENAYYDPETSQITLCYELIQRYKEIFADNAETEEEYVIEIINAALFTFFHELGHALVDRLELPITGKEEDVVDEFAALILLGSGEEGEQAALAGVLQFAVDAEEEAELEELAYWDEHSLSIQRFYNMACLVYGSNSEKYSFLVEDGDLPQERADGCEYEYAQKSNSWEILLAPYLKE